MMLAEISNNTASLSQVFDASCDAEWRRFHVEAGARRPNCPSIESIAQLQPQTRQRVAFTRSTELAPHAQRDVQQFHAEVPARAQVPARANRGEWQYAAGHETRAVAHVKRERVHLHREFSARRANAGIRVPGPCGPPGRELEAIIVQGDMVVGRRPASERVLLAVQDAGKSRRTGDVAPRTAVLAEGPHRQREAIALEYAAPDRNRDEIARLRAIDR